MSGNIVLLGVLFLGGFVGFLLGLTLQLPKSPSLKVVVGTVGAALGGSPLAFMRGLEYHKWMYPVGLVVGLLWTRVLDARPLIGKPPKKSQKTAWYIAWADTASVIFVTLVITVSAAFVDLTERKAKNGDDPTPVTRQMMPCRWAWVFLGKYSASRLQYLVPEGFRYADARIHNPVPNVGDEVVLVRDVKLLITNYKSAGVGQKCDSLLEPPWGYEPSTATEFEAGDLKPQTLVLVNQVVLMPSAQADPANVWALIGSRY